MTIDNFDKPLSSCFKVKKDSESVAEPSSEKPIKTSDSYQSQVDRKSRILSMSVYKPKNYKKKLILAGAVILAQITLYLLVVLQPDTVIVSKDGNTKDTISAQSAQIVTVAATRFAIAGFREKYSRMPKSIQELIPEFLPGNPIDPVSKEALIFDPNNMDIRLASSQEKTEPADGNQQNNAKVLYTFPKEKTISLVAENSFDKVKSTSHWEILAGLPAMMRITIEPTELITFKEDTAELYKIEISDWVFQREEQSYFAAKAQARVFTKQGEVITRGLANAYLKGAYSSEKGLLAELYLAPIQGTIEEQLSVFKDVTKDFLETIKNKDNSYSVRAYLHITHKNTASPVTEIQK